MEQKLPEFPDFVLSYGYDRPSKEWKLIGYTCLKCERTLKFLTAVPKHMNVCRGKGKKKEDQPEVIINTKGEIWSPYTIKS